jgi:fatty-acyl-CoA synthase
VEEAIKTHAGVQDAVVVGVPDARLGQVVAALVAGTPDAEAIKAHVRGKLAGYKVPRHVMVATSVERAATGKADYNAVRERILAWLGKET